MAFVPSRHHNALVGAVASAGFTFLCVLGVGAALVVGAKLQIAALGAGASPWAVLKAVAVVSLGALGAPVDLGGVEVQVLPLGGLVAVGWGALVALRAAAEPRAAQWSLAFVAVFVILSVGAAALGRFQMGEGDLAVSPVAAALAAAGWGLVVVVLERLWAARACDRLPSMPREALSIAGRALAWFGALALAVVVAAGLARAVAQSPSIAAAGGTVVHGVAFAPNLGIAVGALALGAPVDAGFGPLGDEARVGIPAYSLLDWDGGPTPLPVWGLLAIPVVSLVLTGRRVRRPATIVPAGFLFAVACGFLAWVGDARIGLDAADQGFAQLAPDAAWTFVLALGWALVGLSAGWLARSPTVRDERTAKQRSD